MNFHFNPNNPNKSNLLQQLEKVNQDIDMKKRQVQKKKLQQQFYEDDISNKKNINLADQIMNQLMMNTKPSNQNLNQNNQQMYKNINNFNNPKFQQINQSQQVIRNKFLPSESPIPQRQNHFINKRQLQKQKLQNQVYQQNPFGSKNQQVKRSTQKDYNSKKQHINIKEYSNNKQIVNERQLQKIKLQQQQGNQDNPFWGEQRNRSNQRPISAKVQIPTHIYHNQRELQKLKLQQKSQLQPPPYQNNYLRGTNKVEAQKDYQTTNVSKQAAFQNRYSNPFVKDQEFLKQKREEQQRQYRRALEEQRLIEEERKKKQKQMVKQQKIAFNDIKTKEQRAKQQQQRMKSPSIGNQSKKVDPNGKPPVHTFTQNKTYTSSADVQYMKMKAKQLKDLYKKGRILHSQYISQVKKLAQFYKVHYTQLVDPKDLDDQTKQQLPWIAEEKRKKEEKQEKQRKIKAQTAQKQVANHFQIVENDQSLEKIPQSQTSLRQNQNQHQSSGNEQLNFQTYPVYNQNGSYPGNGYAQNLSNINPSMIPNSFMQQFATMDHQLMRQMFQQMKSMRNDYTKSIQKQKTFLQQTFIKFMSQMQQTQLLATQNSQPNLNSRNQVYSSPKTINVHPAQLPSQSQLTDKSVDYIQKSLSGIVNKIPFNKNQSYSRNQSYNKNQQFNKYQYKKEQTIDQFFRKSYKVKKFKTFSLVVDVAQQTMEIPVTSKFIQYKNGKSIVNSLFQQDLIIMKRLQRQKEVSSLRNRVDNQLNYADTFNQKPQRISTVDHRQQKIKTQINQSYNEYQNYSRQRKSKQSQINSSQLNHRSYRKVGNDQQQIPSSVFIKKHISSHEQVDPPNFSDQSDIKFRSPVYFSPKLNAQILEQDQYQTSQKQKKQLQSEFYGDNMNIKYNDPTNIKSPQIKANDMKKKAKAYQHQRQSQRKSKQRLAKSPPKIMSMLKSNNLILQKYQRSAQKQKIQQSQQQIDIKQYSSINSNIPRQEQFNAYFSSKNQINRQSDKFNSHKQYQDQDQRYQQSLQTIKSQHDVSQSPYDFKSIPNSNIHQKYKSNQNNKQTPLQDNSIQYQESYRESRRPPGSVNYSQTIQSIEQSSSKLIKPPLNKKKSTSKKKQTTISRSKFDKESIMYRPPNTQNKPDSMINQSKDSDRLADEAPLKFDSQVYDSEYDETVDAKMLQKKIQALQNQSERIININDLGRNKSKQPYININPPVIVQPQQMPNISSKANAGFSSSNVSTKLKSLEEARNLAKQSKKKSISINIQQNEYQKYEQKMSQLQSFLTKRDESILTKREESILTKRDEQIFMQQKQKQKQGSNRMIKLSLKQQKPKKSKSPLRDKNIMNLLDQLESQSAYKDDFQSYKQQSQKFYSRK